MYEILVKAHGGLAMLALLLSLGWTGVTLAASNQATGAAFGGLRKGVYIGAVALTSLVGVLGLVLLIFLPEWLGQIFTWIGVGVLIAYPMVGARSRRALVAGDKAQAIGFSLAMTAMVIIAYGAMVAKPF